MLAFPNLRSEKPIESGKGHASPKDHATLFETREKSLSR